MILINVKFPIFKYFFLFFAKFELVFEIYISYDILII